MILEDRLLGEFNDFLLVDKQYLENYVLEYAFRHNYTTNREAIVEAIEDRYTYWPDASDEDAIRRQFIHVLLLSPKVLVTVHHHSEAERFLADGSGK